MISVPVILSMVLTLVVVLVVPMVLLVLLKLRTHTPLMPFLAGAAVYMIAGWLLANLLGGFIPVNIPAVAYLLIQCALVAALEVGGRCVAFAGMRKSKGNAPAQGLAYGLGHGFMDLVMAAGLPTISYLMTTSIVNTQGKAALLNGVPDSSREATRQQLDLLVRTGADQFLQISGECLIELALQIALSVVVWMAINKRAQGVWIFGAALLRVASLLPGWLYRVNSGLPIWGKELLSVCMAVVACALAWTLHRAWQRQSSVQATAIARPDTLPDLAEDLDGKDK